jgi:hypothetical protein
MSLEVNSARTTAVSGPSRAHGHPAPRRVVLEIGGGHNPYPQSDVIVDKFLENKERGGNLKIDGRPVVIADFQQLPFKDGSFSYAICSHVLEHVEDVGAALGELTRVARAGYLETPSAITEVVEPHREYHRWYVIRQGAKLLFYPKRKGELPRQAVLNRLISGNFAFKLFFLSNPDLAATRLRWKKRVDFEVMPESAPMELDRLYPQVRQSPVGLLSGVARHYLGKLRRRLADKTRSGRAPLDITSLLCCPVCKADFRIEGDRLICAQCLGYYRREGNFYHLLKESLIPL